MVEYSSSGLDGVFSSLADPTRRAILERLAQGEATVSELARPHGVTLQAISKHVRKLEASGLVLRRREGREVYCTLLAEPMRVAATWLETQHRFWEARLDALRTVVEAPEGPSAEVSETSRATSSEFNTNREDRDGHPHD